VTNRIERHFEHQEPIEAGSALLRSLLILGMSLAPIAAMADLGDATTIASGLANPRGIAFAPNGALYVAEAGSGGPGPCIPSPVPGNGDRCYGETGAITRIFGDGSVKRVLTGLPSMVLLRDGTVEGGVTDVAFFGTTAFVTMGWGGNPADRAALGKNLGDDLAEGKPTLPLIYALSRAAPEDAARLRSAIEQGGVEDLEAITRTIESSGGLEYTARLAQREKDLAIEALGRLPESAHTQALRALAEFAVGRSF